MNVIYAGYEFVTPINGDAILKRIETCARTCYKSEGKITQRSAAPFVASLIKRGHEAMLEHIAFTVRFICDRGVSHELVRHRLASYAQESTRYVKYDDTIECVAPCFWPEGSSRWVAWEIACSRETVLGDLPKMFAMRRIDHPAASDRATKFLSFVIRCVWLIVRPLRMVCCGRHHFIEGSRDEPLFLCSAKDLTSVAFGLYIHLPNTGAVRRYRAGHNTVRRRSPWQ